MINRINLAPQKSSAKKYWAICYTLTVAFFVSACLLLFVMHKTTLLKIQNVEQLMKQSILYQDNVVKLQAKVTRLKQSITRNKEQIKQLTVGASKFNQIRKEKNNYSKVMKTIASNLPDSIVCKNIAITNNTGSITGVAMFYSELPDFVDRLRSLKRIYSSVTLQSIGKNKQSNNSAPYSFKVVFNLHQVGTS